MTATSIRTTQQLANAAETFVSALGALFPGDTFNEFFHGETVRRAYWSALQQALDHYITPETTPLAAALMGGQVLADQRVVAELLKLFVPNNTPDYALVAEVWKQAVPGSDLRLLAEEAQRFFKLLVGELRRSPDLRLALQQLVQVHRLVPDHDASRDDLERLLDSALLAGPATLGRQVRHLLALAEARQQPGAPVNGSGLVALANLSENLAPDALRALWARLDDLDDPAQRLYALGRLAPRLKHFDLVQDPLALIRAEIERHADRLPPALRVSVLLDLAPHLTSPELDRLLPSFQERMLAGALTIQDAASRVRALGALVEKLPPQLQYEAVSMAFETAACCIPSDMARATALSGLPPHLPPDYHTRLMAIASSIVSPDARALLLGRMIAYLPPTLQSQALRGALAAVEEINGDEGRCRALIALAPQINAMGTLRDIPDALQQVITVTFSIERPDDRARAFAALAPCLSPELLGEALQAIKTMHNDDDRALTLIKFAPHLPDNLCVAAYSIAQEIRPAQARAAALSAIAPYLSPQARAQALADALVAALSIEGRYDRVVALVDLAPHLPDDLQRRALQEAMTATRSIPVEDERSRALVFLAPYLPEEGLPDALADAYTILDPMAKVPALSALMPYLPDKPRLRVAQDVIDTAARMPAFIKASLLAAIAPVMPDEVVDEAVAVALQIDAPYDRLHVLTALLPRRPERLRDVALHAARAVPDRYQRVSALLEVAPHTTAAARYGILDEALTTALEIEDDYDRASAIAHLTPYVDMQRDDQNGEQDALRWALDLCLEVDEPSLRTGLLERWATVTTTLLSPAQAYPLWRQIVAFLREQPYAQVVADLAALAPLLNRMTVPGSSDATHDLTEAVIRAVLE